LNELINISYIGLDAFAGKSGFVVGIYQSKAIKRGSVIYFPSQFFFIRWKQLTPTSLILFAAGKD
jgi:hypothetical protein